MHQYDELNLCLQQMKTGYHSLYCDSFVVLTILSVTLVNDITQGMNAIRHYISNACVFALAFRLHFTSINVSRNIAHSRMF